MSSERTVAAASSPPTDSTFWNAIAPGSPLNATRCPSFFSFARVNNVRRTGGISSLMFVTTTLRIFVPSRAAFTTG